MQRWSRRPVHGLAIVLTTLVVPAASAQPISRGASGENGVFLRTARKLLKWDEPAEPARLLGPIYFVGTQGLGVFLVAGPQGHILINSGMPGSGPMIEA